MTSRAGTTLMELLMIILIISVMSSIVLPTVDSFYSSEQVTAAASMLTSDIRYGRGYAIENQCYIRMTFPAEGESWLVEEAWDIVNDVPLASEATAAYPNWESILDEPERVISPSVTLEFEAGILPLVIYFSPDGLLRSEPGFDGMPIRLTSVKFFLGNAEAAVDISSAGAIESRAWYNYEE